VVTVIKFPIYVEIESDNVDRKRVSDAANQVLHPNLLNFLSDAKFKKLTIEEFRKAIQCDNVSVKLLTEIDLFRERH